MPVVRISKRTVDAATCPSDVRALAYWDETLKGFGLVVTTAGSRSYVVQYRVGGREAKVQRYTINRHGSPWTPEQARDRAAELLRLVAVGVDPGEEERSKRTVKAAAAADEAWFDFDVFADRYIDKHVRRHAERSLKDIESTFRRDLRPAFSGRSVRLITMDDIKAMRAKVAIRSEAAANKAHKWLNAMYMWGIEHDRLVTSPMFGLRKPFVEKPRTRFLTIPELVGVVAALAAMAWRYRALVLLLLVSGQRLREITGMRWEEMDWDAREWLIPGSRTKNGLPHLVPLSTQMAALIEAIAGERPRVGLLLSSNGTSPISGFSKWKAQLDTLLVEAGTPVLDWVVHDLRRTFSTLCTSLRIPRDHVEASMNHVSGAQAGVAGTYNVYTYRDEKAATLQKWGDHVEAKLGSVVGLLGAIDDPVG